MSNKTRVFRRRATQVVSRRVVFTGLVLGFVASATLYVGLMSASAGAQAFPAQADPGRVLQQYQRNQWMRQNTPWLFNTVRKEDIEKPKDVEIEFHEMQVNTEVLRQAPTQ